MLRLAEGRDGPEKVNYLVIFLFSGHGLLEDGQHSMLFNEYDDGTKFYKKLKVEAQIRHFAHTFPNSYMLTIFSSCRQLYVKEEMTDCHHVDNVSIVKTESLQDS